MRRSSVMKQSQPAPSAAANCKLCRRQSGLGRSARRGQNGISSSKSSLPPPAGTVQAPDRTHRAAGSPAAPLGAHSAAAAHAAAAGAAAEHLHVVGDDLGGEAVVAVLVLPFAGAQLALDEHLRTLCAGTRRRFRPAGRTARCCATRCAPAARPRPCPSRTRWWQCGYWSPSCRSASNASPDPRPRFPTRMTLLTPRAMTIPLTVGWHGLYTPAGTPIKAGIRRPIRAEIGRTPPSAHRAGGRLRAEGLDAGRIVSGYMQNIRIRGARTHNLKNIDLDLPRDRLIVLTGLSGSGKSSLAFDTIYAEGQRRYVESLSTYARQFLSMMEKPDVDTIEGLSPAISIEQKSTSHNPRSTVGTVTEIYDYLRLLYARAGTPRCPDHHIDLAAQTVSQMVDAVLAQPEGTAMMLLAPAISRAQGGALRNSSRSCRPAGSCARASTARWWSSTRRRSSTCGASTRSRPSSTASGCGRSGAAAGRILRDRAAAGSGRGAGRLHGRRRARRTRVLEQIRLPDLQLLAERTRTAAVLVQQPDRRLPDLRRSRHAGVLRSRRRSSPIRICRSPAARCAAGTGATPTISSSSSRWRGIRSSTSRRPSRICPTTSSKLVLFGSGDERDRVQVPRRQGRHGQAQARLRRHRPQSGAPLRRDRIGDRARGTGQVPLGARLSRLRRHAPEPGGAQRVRRRQERAGDLGAVGRPARSSSSAASSCPAGAARSPSKIVKEIGDRLGFLGERRPRLSHPGPQRRHPVGRRSPAHPAREPDRLGTGGRDVHPR